MSALVRQLRVEAERAHYRVEGLGVGLPGLVDRAGRLGVAPNLPQGEGLDLHGAVAEELGLPVVVDNDATCAAVAEWQLGAARGTTNVVVLTVGTGIGAGLIVEGGVVHGSRGFAGEAGHMVVDPHGEPCPCGRSGCWERYASGDALGRAARRDAAGRVADVAGIVGLVGGDPLQLRGEHVTAAAVSGDPGACRLMSEVARWLAVGIGGIGVLLDPEIVVVGGGLVDAGEALFRPLRQALSDPTNHGRYPVPTVVAATLGSRAGAIGAAVLGRR